MKSFLYNYEPLNPYERVALCENLRTSLNNANVFLSKLMLDASCSMRSIPAQEEEEVITESKKDAPE